MSLRVAHISTSLPGAVAGSNLVVGVYIWDQIPPDSGPFYYRQVDLSPIGSGSSCNVTTGQYYDPLGNPVICSVPWVGAAVL